MALVFPKILTLFSLWVLGAIGISSSLGSPLQDNISIMDDQRIIGGRPIKQGELPYQLALRLRGNSYCGASLIEVQGVQLALTAAHCVYGFNPALFSMVAGDLDVTDVTGIEQVRQVDQIIIHENYGYPWHLSNDLAVLTFSGKFELNENVAPIPLPPPEEKTSGELVVGGWGRSDVTNDTLSEVLLGVIIQTVDQKICKEIWKRHPSYPAKIDEGMLCAAVEDGKQSPCHGDSGSPARSKATGHFVGIVSFGDRSCNSPIYPAVFVRVSYYLQWIHEKANEVGLTMARRELVTRK